MRFMRAPRPTEVAVKCSVPDCAAIAIRGHKAWRHCAQELPGHPWRKVDLFACGHHLRVMLQADRVAEMVQDCYGRAHPEASFDEEGYLDLDGCDVLCTHDDFMNVLWGHIDGFDNILYGDDMVSADAWAGFINRVPIGGSLDEA